VFEGNGYHDLTRIFIDALNRIIGPISFSPIFVSCKDNPFNLLTVREIMGDSETNPRSKFAFDGLARLDPGREKRLANFLTCPVDSRESDSVAPRLFISGTPLIHPSSKEVLEQDWEARFSRVYRAFKVETRPHAASSTATFGPTLVQRQITSMPDPLHCQNVEEIADQRSAIMQGPVLQLSKLPTLRCLPKGIIMNQTRKSRHHV
jgi:hypothetical protein